METEIWPNFLMEAYRHSVPVVLANGRISDKSYKGYSRLRNLFYQSVRSIRYFCMQDKLDADKLLRLGINPERVMVAGNLKYEVCAAMPVDQSIADNLRDTLRWTDDEPVFVAGSTHQGEEEIVCQSYITVKKSVRNLKMILAPRHPERLAQAEKVLSDFGIKYIRKTLADKNSQATHGVDAVLLDTMGELRHLYAMATVAFVGKSLVPGGGQNILEPASLGKPVVFGPYMDNFEQVSKQILSANAGIMVNNGKELTETLSALFSQKSMRNKIGGNAVKEIKRWHGTTDKIVRCIRQVYH